MAISSVWVKSFGESELSDVLVRQYDVVWIVTVTNTTDTPLHATATGLLPLMYASYAFYGAVDLGATLRGYKVNKTGPKTYEVTGHYSSARNARRWPEDPTAKAGTGTSKGSPDEANPLQRPPEITWGMQKYQEVYTKDRAKPPKAAGPRAVINSAKQRFDPLPTRDASRLTLTITRNEPTFHADQAMKYTDKVNDAKIKVASNDFEAGTLKIDTITAQSQWENGTFFYKITYSLACRQPPDVDELPAAQIIPFGYVLDGWEEPVWDAGTMDLDAAGNSKVIYDRNGSPLTSPIGLDGAGAKLNNPVQSDYKYLIFTPYQRIDFVPLALPK